MLSGGVWKADVKGLPDNAIALGYSDRDPDPKSSATKPDLVPKSGDPILLVYALGMKAGGDQQMPLFQIETIEGQKDKKGAAQYFDRLVINQRAKSVAFRVLLLPVRAGDPLPAITCAPDAQSARIGWKGVTSVLKFSAGNDNRTRVEISNSYE